jgi:exodeoxyribonuclease V gamma subunit
VRDGKPRNPAAPLAELLQFLDEQHGIAADQKDDRPWSVRHPLQPFDARYYERDINGRPLHDPRLFTYNPAFLAAASVARVPRFLVAPQDVLEGDASRPTAGPDISLTALKRYWRDPAKDNLLRQQGISLQALENTSWPDREPLETGISRLERIDRRLLFDALALGYNQLPDAPPAWLARSGMLASGAIGIEAYRLLKQAVQGMLSQAQTCFAGADTATEPQSVDLDLGDGLRLTGTIDRVFRSTDGGLMLFDAKPGSMAGLRDLIAFYIDWAALRLTHGDDIEGVFLESSAASKVTFPKLLEPILAQDTAQLRHGLCQLITMRLAADTQAPLFFPITALAYATANPEDRSRRAADKWEGSDFAGTGERDYAPGYAALLLRGTDLFDESGAVFHAFVEATRQVCDVLDPQHSLLMKTSSSERLHPNGVDA